MQDSTNEGKTERFLDEDRMVNEGLGGGNVMDAANGRIDGTTVDTMDEPESVKEAQDEP